jgi:hypothetical protein
MCQFCVAEQPLIGPYPRIGPPLPRLATCQMLHTHLQDRLKGRRNPDVYRVTVEIDVSVAGQSSTYVFNFVRDGQLTVIQPLGMR